MTKSAKGSKARDFVFDEASARAAGTIHGKRRQEDAARIEKAKKHWGRFYESLIDFCDSASKSMLDDLYPERVDPEINMAMYYSEQITHIRLFPERYEHFETAIDEFEANLKAIIERRNAPAALEERRRIFRQQFDELQARRRARAEAKGITLEQHDQQLMDAVPADIDASLFNFNNERCMIRQSLKYDLANFYRTALKFQAEDPDGRDSFKRLAAKINGESGTRSRPKEDFQNWARAMLKKSPNTSLNALPQKYVDETGSAISVGALRRYLAPSGGFDPKG